MERTYKCNLCRQTEDGKHASERNLVGIHWGAGDRIERKGAREVENHVCHGCLRDLTAIARDIGLISR